MKKESGQGISGRDEDLLIAIPRMKCDDAGQESMNAGADACCLLMRRNEGNEKWQELNALFLNWCVCRDRRDGERSEQSRAEAIDHNVMLVESVRVEEAYLWFIV